MKFILKLPDKERVEITEQERIAILEAIQKNLPVVVLSRTGAVISLRPAPTILPVKESLSFSHGQYIPTIHEMLALETPETRKKELAYHDMKMRLISDKSVEPLNDFEQKIVREEIQERTGV